MDKEVKMLTALMLLTIITVTVVFAVTIWTFYGGYITVVEAVSGKVLYSYDNETWIEGNITVYKSNSISELYVAFNVTSYPKSMNYNFTFYLNETKIGEIKTVLIDSVPKMVYCTEVLDDELAVGNIYQVKVEVSEASA